MSEAGRSQRQRQSDAASLCSGGPAGKPEEDKDARFVCEACRRSDRYANPAPQRFPKEVYLPFACYGNTVLCYFCNAFIKLAYKGTKREQVLTTLKADEKQLTYVEALDEYITAFNATPEGGRVKRPAGWNAPQTVTAD